MAEENKVTMINVEIETAEPVDKGRVERCFLNLCGVVIRGIKPGEKEERWKFEIDEQDRKKVHSAPEFDGKPCRVFVENEANMTLEDWLKNDPKEQEKIEMVDRIVSMCLDPKQDLKRIFFLPKNIFIRFYKQVVDQIFLQGFNVKPNNYAYCAPELIRNNFYNQEATSVWSFGALIYQIAFPLDAQHNAISTHEKALEIVKPLWTEKIKDADQIIFDMYFGQLPKLETKLQKMAFKLIPMCCKFDANKRLEDMRQVAKLIEETRLELNLEEKVPETH